MMPTLQLINGQTELAFKTKPGGVWPALEGTVRPASPVEERAHDMRVGVILGGDATPEAKAKALVEEQAKFYAAHIKTWNVAGADVSPAAVQCLPNEIFRQLDGVVTGKAGIVLGNSAGTSAS